MSPEQAQGHPTGAPSDVFSLGLVLAYAATGVPPFGGEVSAAVLLYRVLHEEPELGALDAELRATVQACLAKSPADRISLPALRERLGPAALLGQSGWLPPAVAGAVGMRAVELLDLEADPATSRAVSPGGGFGPPPTPSAVAPPTLPPPPGEAPSRRGRRSAAATAVLLVAAVVGAALWFFPGAPKPSAAASGPHTSAPAADGVVPQSFLGTWQGQFAATSSVTTNLHLTLHQGGIGEEVGDLTATDPDASTCSFPVRLASAGPASLTVRPATGGGCVTGADPDPETYTLDPDGTLRLVAGSVTAQLTRED
jgi:eukaryotic-like serine/threonine-protein kinase